MDGEGGRGGKQASKQARKKKKIDPDGRWESEVQVIIDRLIN